MLLEVAPLVGAWVEISQTKIPVKIYTVAPLVGAWVEIFIQFQSDRIKCVAPLVGAWVEISKVAAYPDKSSGRSPRGSVG